MGYYILEQGYYLKRHSNNFSNKLLSREDLLILMFATIN